MKIFYEPKGPARELASLALNFATGCTKGCWYCYAPAQLRMNKKDFFAQSVPKKDVIARLVHDLDYLDKRGDDRKVFMSFTHDPLLPELWPLTKDILFWLNHFKRRWIILTKFPKKLWEVFIEFGILGEYGMTYTGVENSDYFEPILALAGAGQKTFISMEPVLNTKRIRANLDLLSAYDYLGQIWIGKLNHSKEKPVSDDDWKEFRKHIECDYPKLNIKFKEGS